MTTYYNKIGRRYHPVSEDDAFRGIQLGYWLVHVKAGCTSARPIDPAMSEVESAIKIAEDAMASAMYEVCHAKGVQVPRNDQHKEKLYKKGYEAWKAIVGDVPMYFEGVSMQDVIEAGLNALRQEMQKKAG